MRELFLAQQDSVFPQFQITQSVNDGARAVIDFLEPLLDVIKSLLGWLVEDLMMTVLTGPPDLVLVLVLAALAWLARGWGLAIFTAVAFSAIASTGFFFETMQTLALVLVATVIAILIGIPVGIWASRNDAVSTTARPILDFMQTMPSFVYLLIVVLMFSIGPEPGVVASVVFAMPPSVRLTELGIRQVDSEVVEAANAFGATPGEVLRGVQLPLALPTIMAGVNQVIMLSLSMVVIAGLAGAPGLGAQVVQGVTRLQLGLGLISGLAVVILAVFLDRTTGALGTARRGS